jgi:hypothetical protein
MELFHQIEQWFGPLWPLVWSLAKIVAIVEKIFKINVKTGEINEKIIGIMKIWTMGSEIMAKAWGMEKAKAGCIDVGEWEGMAETTNPLAGVCIIDNF